MKVTAPVALSGVTVAVSVTAWPRREGFGAEASATDEEPITTDCVIAGEVLAVKLELPE